LDLILFLFLIYEKRSHPPSPLSPIILKNVNFNFRFSKNKK
jgi:hypothetical protein